MASGSFSLWQLGKWFGFGQSPLLDAGIRALRNGEYAAAADSFQTALSERNPAIRDLARRLLHDSLVSDAEESNGLASVSLWRRAVDLHPNYPDIRLSLARSLAAVGSFDEALEEVENSLQRNPRYREAKLERAMLLARLGKWDDAIQGATQALEFATHDENEQFEFVKKCHQNGDNDRALTNLILLATPKDSPILQAMHLAMDRQFAEAEAEYKALVEQHPHFPDLRCHYAQVLMELGHDDGAREQLESAIEINPRYAEAHAQLGIVLKRLGMVKESSQHFKAAIEIDSNHPIARIELGRLNLN